MVVTLAPNIERMVRECVARGDYESEDALVQQAIENLFEEDASDHIHLTEIRRRIEIADTEINHGGFVEYEESRIAELAEDVHQRGIRKINGSG